jgi:hypothetical protein
MSAKTILLIVILIYILIVILNSLNVNGNSSHFAAPYFILILLFLFYSIFSALLTSRLYRAGAFQWISANPDVLKIILIIGIPFILYTVFTSIMIRADWSTYQDRSISKPQDFLAFTAYIWVPLLMILPYAMTIYKNEMAIDQNAWLKSLLTLNVFLGFVLFIYFKIYIHYKPFLSTSFNSANSAYHPDIEKIQSVVKLDDYIHYTKPDYDIKIRDAAFAKLKSDPKWDEQFYNILEDCSNNYTIGRIYEYLSTYTFEYPEKLMPHFKKSVSCIVTYVHEYAANEYTSGEDLSGLNIDKVLLAIEKQYPGTEKMLFDSLDELSSALKGIKRNDYKSKTAELIIKIENFKEKFQ